MKTAIPNYIPTDFKLANKIRQTDRQTRKQYVIIPIEVTTNMIRMPSGDRTSRHWSRLFWTKKIEWKGTTLLRCPTVYPKKYAHGFVVLCYVVVKQSFIMNSHEVFIQIHQGCFAGTGAIVWLPQCQWSKSDGYGKISQCITTTKHSKAKTVCIFLGIYCM